MAQKTDAELTTEADVIGNETTPEANTADRVRDMLVNVIDSKVNNDDAVTSVNGDTGVVVLGAGDIGFTPSGGIAATDVSGALNELDSEKATTASVALKQDLVNSATALVDAGTMDLTAIKHTLASSSATRTFTISYTGDDITLEVTLSAVTATYTFPATSLCVSDGVASGDNTCVLAGTSGDKYIIAIKKVGSAYYVVCKNFLQ